MTADRSAPEPGSELVLTDIAQLRAMSDPLRLRLVEVMNDEPRGWTAKELAERLGTKQTKLYHHLNLLAEHGLIRVAGTRMVSGIVEKRYQVSARSFRVDRTLLTGEGQAGVGEVIDVIFDRARDEILGAMAAGLVSLDKTERKRSRMSLSMTHARLSPKSVRRVMRMVEQLNAIDESPDADGEDYGLVIGFYPRATQGTDR